MRAAVRAALVGCIVVAAAALPVAVASRRPHAAATVSGIRRVDAPQHPISFAGVGATVSAPPRHAKPVFTQSDVVKMIARNSFQQTVSGGSRPSTISLVMYENAFGLTHPGRPDTPSVPNQLAWLITSKGVSRPLAAGGPAMGRHATLKPNSLMLCTSYVAVSAISGKNLDGFSMCH